MKFFNIDCHISVISDIKNIFESLGHSVDHWSLSGNRCVFHFPSCDVVGEALLCGIDEIIGDTSKIGAYKEFSKVGYDKLKEAVRTWLLNSGKK